MAGFDVRLKGVKVHVRLSNLRWGVSLAVLAGLGTPARALYLDTYLPASVPGLDREQGVTVLSRVRPLYREPGVRVGSFLLRGGIEESLGYDSNVTAWVNAPRSAFARTTPTISATSDWNRNRLGFDLSIDQYAFFSAPRQNYTNYNVGVGGGWTILDDLLNIGYAHQHGHEFGNDIGTIAYGAPVTYDVNTLRADYTYRTGRFQFTPTLSLDHYTYGSASVAGQEVSQSFRDRTVLTGGVTTRYSLSDQRGLLFVAQGSSTHYLQPQLGMPAANSKSILLLPGLDYQADGPWRYRILAGGEVRMFEAPQYRTWVAPILDASVIYTPTELTTVTATVRREIQDPQAEGSSGLTFTGFKLTIDHEYLRNVLLHARGEIGSVKYFDAGSSLQYGLGASATWLVNDHLSLSASYQYSRQDSSGGSPRTTVQASAQSLPSFTRNVAMVTAKWRL